jgi:hypothetical protein
MRGTSVRIHILLLLAGGIPAHASDIVNFEIVNSSSFSQGGGIFTSGGGGTFSGWFQVDVSKIPQDGSAGGFDLTSWDIFTTDPAGLGFGDMEFNPGNSSGAFDVTLAQNYPFLGTRQADAVTFAEASGQATFQLQLLMLEPVGLFRGGIVIDATDTRARFPQPPITMSDALGTGLVLDPAVFSPEPGSGWLIAAGLGALLAARRLLNRGPKTRLV